MRFPVNRYLPLAAMIFLGAGAAVAREHAAPLPAAPVTGPAADYPVVVGEPFTIGGTIWTPTDQLNYDAVGLADVSGSADDAALAGVSAAHKTLPLPSYIEVTSLDSGRTILVRVTKRGPMTNDALVELSTGAAAQLGLPAGSHGPVRVRRVNPPEQERAMLRGGGRAPERIATPEGLLKVLRRKLASQSPLLPPPSVPPTMPTNVPLDALAKTPAAPPARATALVSPKPVVASASLSQAPSLPKAPAAKVPAGQPATPLKEPATKPSVPRPAAAKPSVSKTNPSAQPAPARHGTQVVQVGTFSSQANARALAGKLGGQASAAGKFWRVHLGPYASHEAASAALEKAKRAGYTDARIQSVD